MNKKINIDNKKFQQDLLNLKKTSQIKKTKREIARLKTKISNNTGDQNA